MDMDTWTSVVVAWMEFMHVPTSWTLLTTADLATAAADVNLPAPETNAEALIRQHSRDQMATRCLDWAASKLMGQQCIPTREESVLNVSLPLLL